MKKAFTLIEVIFIIVVVGILSTIAISRFNSKDLLRGAEMVARDIEYVKHLAVIDDNKILNNTKSEKKLISNNGTSVNQYNFWAITFIGIGGDPKMSIFKYTDPDINYGTVDTAVVDYLDKEKFLTLTVRNGKDDDIVDGSVVKTSPRVWLKKTYSINKIDTSDCNAEDYTGRHSVNTLFFNEEGIPYIANSSGGTFWYFQKLKEICTLKIKAGSDTKCIDIYPETGYVKVRECS